jgi:hypothetical protein
LYQKLKIRFSGEEKKQDFQFKFKTMFCKCPDFGITGLFSTTWTLFTEVTGNCNKEIIIKGCLKN